MSESEYAKIIARNLRNIAFEAGKTQADISRDLGINKATISSWMNGTRIPRMDKIDLLCNYFNVTRADVMEGKQSPTIAPSERQLLSAYRAADDLTKQMILRLLGLENEKKDTASA